MPRKVTRKKIKIRAKIAHRPTLITTKFPHILRLNLRVEMT